MSDRSPRKPPFWSDVENSDTLELHTFEMLIAAVESNLNASVGCSFLPLEVKALLTEKLFVLRFFSILV